MSRLNRPTMESISDSLTPPVPTSVQFHRVAMIRGSSRLSLRLISLLA